MLYSDSPEKDIGPECRLTIDEELNVLDESVRRLKVEYDVYFGGGSKKPPVDTDWRVQSMIKRHSDSQRLNFTQRFKYNSIVQRYSVFNALWQQKLKIKEEGYRRPQDAILAIQGLRTEQEHEAAAQLEQKHSKPAPQPFAIECTDPERDRDKVHQLYDAMIEARRRVGEAPPPAKFDSFLAFVKTKTAQIRNEHHCNSVEYRVEIDGGHVKLKAKAKS
jgi:hypothetical protein